MALKFDREVIKDAQGRVKYRVLHSGGRDHYNLRIWLAGSEQELNEVTRVDYVLHPSFRDRYRSSSNRDDKFAISLWTWGMFAIQVTIHYKNGKAEERQFYLSFDLPADDGTNYIDVGR